MLKKIKILIILILILITTSCSILDKLDFPDEVHERIENQGNTNMSNDSNFPVL